MTDETQPPLVVNSSPWLSIVGIALRQIGLIGGSITTLFNLLSAHDIRGIFDYISGSEFFLALGVATTLVIAGYGYVREWLSRKKLVKVANADPDNVVVKGK